MSFPNERRRNRRVSLPHRPGAFTDNGTLIHILDLSPYGARIQHGAPLVDPDRCRIMLPANTGCLARMARVVWCRPQREAGTAYESGLEFRASR